MVISQKAAFYLLVSLVKGYNMKCAIRVISRCKGSNVGLAVIADNPDVFMCNYSMLN